MNQNEPPVSTIEGKAELLVKWNLIALPALTFVNALPCSLELELVQSPHASSDTKSAAPQVSLSLNLSLSLSGS